MEKASLNLPLVSCITPTINRPFYLKRSIDMFLAQDYQNKEMVVLYNKAEDLPHVPQHDQVKYYQCRTMNIGNKRNLACERTSGAIIVQWDDDDIYSPTRLSAQVAPLLNNEAYITGLNNFVFLEQPTGLCYTADDLLFKNAFSGLVHCGTLVYWKSLWQNVAKYPNLNVGEDFNFLLRLKKQGIEVMPVDGYNQFVYVRHTANTWKFEQNNFRRYSGWNTATAPLWAESHIAQIIPNIKSYF